MSTPFKMKRSPLDFDFWKQVKKRRKKLVAKKPGRSPEELRAERKERKEYQKKFKSRF